MEPESESEFDKLTDRNESKRSDRVPLTRELIWDQMLFERKKFITQIRNIIKDEIHNYYVELVIRDDSDRINTNYLPSGKFKLFYKNKLQNSIKIRFPIIQSLFLELINDIIKKPLVFNIYFERSIYTKMINQPWVTVVENKPLQTIEFNKELNLNKDNGFKVMNAFLDLILKFKNVHGFFIFKKEEITIFKTNNFKFLFRDKFEKEFIDPYDIELYGNSFVYFVRMNSKFITKKEEIFVSEPSFRFKTTKWLSNLLLLTNNKDIRYFIKDIPNEYQKIINDNGGWEDCYIYDKFAKFFDVKRGKSPYENDKILNGKAILQGLLKKNKYNKVNHMRGYRTFNGYTLTYMVELIFLILHNIRLKNSNWFDRKPFEETFSKENKTSWINIIDMLNYFIIIIVQYIQEKLPAHIRKGIKYEKEEVFNNFLINIKKFTNNDFQNYYDKPTIELLLIYIPLKIFVSRIMVKIILDERLNVRSMEQKIDKSFMEQYCITVNDENNVDLHITEMVINCENPQEHTYEEQLRMKIIEDIKEKKRKREENEDEDENKKKKRKLQFKIGTNYYHFGKNLFF